MYVRIKISMTRFKHDLVDSDFAEILTFHWERHPVISIACRVRLSIRTSERIHFLVCRHTGSRNLRIYLLSSMSIIFFVWAFYIQSRCNPSSWAKNCSTVCFKNVIVYFISLLKFNNSKKVIFCDHFFIFFCV